MTSPSTMTIGLKDLINQPILSVHARGPSVFFLAIWNCICGCAVWGRTTVPLCQSHLFSIIIYSTLVVRLHKNFHSFAQHVVLRFTHYGLRHH